jgi:hypothetical protein
MRGPLNATCAPVCGVADVPLCTDSLLRPLRSLDRPTRFACCESRGGNRSRHTTAWRSAVSHSDSDSIACCPQ